MPTYAGTMSSAAQPNPQWVPATRGVFYVLDHTQSYRTPIPGTPSTGDRRDYWRATGRWGVRRGLGPSGWVFVVPYNTTTAWMVSTADDNSEGTIASPPTVQNPPAGTTA